MILTQNKKENFKALKAEIYALLFTNNEKKFFENLNNLLEFYKQGIEEA